MSRTKAINEYCKMCIYDPKAGGSWREQVEACTSKGRCPLWEYRPLTVATINLHRKTRDVETSIDEDEEVAA